MGERHKFMSWIPCTSLDSDFQTSFSDSERIFCIAHPGDPGASCLGGGGGPVSGQNQPETISSSFLPRLWKNA
jgi:hypothetical protein